jgi:hypothetical protein
MQGHKAQPIEMTAEIFDRAQRMFDAGRRQITFRQEWTDGTGQKLFALFECNLRFRQVKLAERVRVGLEMLNRFRYDEGGGIAYEALDKESLRKIAHDKHQEFHGEAGLEAYIRKSMS